MDIKCDIAVAGGGPAGMLAAIAAARHGADTVLVEKNRSLGKKLLMTGNGRCNITHNEDGDIKEFIEAFGRNGRFLYPALNAFSIKDTIYFFRDAGVKTKTESDGRVFPADDRSQTVLAALSSQLEKHRVSVLLEEEIRKIEILHGLPSAFVTSGRHIKANRFIIAAGGLAYPSTGSTGDGYRWAEKLGHSIITPGPALAPVLTEEKWVKELQGLQIKDTLANVFHEGKKKLEFIGEILFTHEGISGPSVLDISGRIGALLTKGGPVEIGMDFSPSMEPGSLDERLQEIFLAYSARTVKNSLAGIVPNRMAPVMARLAGINPDSKAAVVRREERRRLAQTLKDLRITVKSVGGFDRAMVTAGGISLKEIEPKSMESRLCRGVYFAGEAVDLDGPSGGYNLQMCWSTGYLAGTSAGMP